jgi:hypothetical protein
MAININRAITRSLQKQLDQVAMQQNENENVMEGELLLAKFHILEIIQYTMPRIPKIEERLARYKTLSIAIMEPQETFIGKTMKQFSVRARLPMRAKLPEVEPKKWGDNAPRVTPTNMQSKERERTKMNMSTQRHGILYRSKEISHMYQEVEGGMETRSIDKGFVW